MPRTSVGPSGIARPEVPNLWTFDAPQPYAGRIRNEAGQPLCGFRVKDSKTSRTVSILDNGHNRRDYRYPREAVAPRHPMVRWFNVPMCGLTFRGADGTNLGLGGDDAIVQAVLEGRKPAGDFFFRKERSAEKARLVAKARAAGLEVIVYERPDIQPGTYVMIGASQPLSELFDIDVIGAFYAQWTGIPAECFLNLLDKVADLTPAQALRTYDWSSPVTPAELVLTGLALGYAFESTLALLLEKL